MPNRTLPAEVDRIATMSDPVLRNREITRSYYELSLALTKRTGSCANWCTFATWASRQAGQSIRKEDFREALKHWLAVDPVLGEAILEIAGAAFRRSTLLDKNHITGLVWEAVHLNAIMDRASAAVARGNQKVYAEIGRAFAQFLTSCGQDPVYDAQSIARFCSTLQPGDPPDGQRYVIQAFGRYYRAFFEPDEKTKAEFILLSNIEIGFHEQTRLQPEIAEALDAAVLDPALLRDKLVKALFPNQSWISSLGAVFRNVFNRPTPIETAVNTFVQLLRQRIRLFLTAHMMELGFPKDMILHLGKDLALRYPPTLEKLANAELIGLLKTIDPTPDSLQETAATDWANLQERLHFIADLFRCCQERAELLGAPFEGEDEEIYGL